MITASQKYAKRLMIEKAYIAGSATTSFTSTSSPAAIVVPDGMRYRGQVTVVLSINFAAIQSVDLKFFIWDKNSFPDFYHSVDAVRVTVLKTGLTENFLRFNFDLGPGTYSGEFTGVATAAWVGSPSLQQTYNGFLETL